jgi:trans-AT polyketide synthase, acyltransferase and oxidoreductase domains
MHSLDEAFSDHGLSGTLHEIFRDDRTPADSFDALRYTHPAILMVELSLAEALRSDGVEPDYVLGASLGEFAAATVAGVMDAEQLARSVAEQVQLVEEHCPAGAMTAVFDDPALYRAGGRQDRLDPGFCPGLELAAINFDRHFVVSGAPADMTRFEGALQSRRVLHQRLPVKYAFHSAYMNQASGPYRRALSGLELKPSRVPMVSCADVGILKHCGTEHLWRMVREPIRFRDAVQFLERREENVCYLDLGPTGTMANFAARNFRPDGRSDAIALMNPFDRSSSAADRIGRVARSRRSPVGGRRSPVGGRTRQRGDHMKSIIFPGQGAQSRGMGSHLFAEFPELISEADSILGYSVAQLCTEDPERRLGDTRFTQPALYVVSALQYLANTRDGRPGAEYFAGHSLGEYSALLAAGAFDFATGLRLVQERSRLMAEIHDGGMAAVVGLHEDTVRTVLAEQGLTELDLANFNAPDQLILSGPRKAISAAQEAFIGAGARAYTPLRVSGAFHSRYMAPARREFERFLDGFQFRTLTVPVIANMTALPYEPGAVRRLLAGQLVSPVLWEQSVRYLIARGVTEFEEVGPGAVLTRLVSGIRKTPPRSSGSPEQAPGPVSAPAATAQDRPGVQPRREKVPRATLTAENLGSAAFREAYGVRYAYVCGSMYRGIASESLVVRAARAGFFSFFGSGGLGQRKIAAAIDRLTAELGPGSSFGVNVVHNPTLPAVEESTVDLLLDRGVHTVEASAFMKVTPALVRYRLRGLAKGPNGETVIANRLIAKVSRPEVAESFLAPAPARIVGRLEAEGLITAEQAALASQVPMADDLCVEADSGGHTDRGASLVLLPTMRRLCDRLTAEYGYPTPVRVGTGGGIGTPEAAAAAFMLGADFILTGSINLCTVESGMSDLGKDMLEAINVQDTDYAPAGDMFEMGAQVQVLKRGVFFPARARKLYDLYRQHESLEDIAPETRQLLENRYFRRSFDDVWGEVTAYFSERDPGEIAKAEQNPKHKMALVFRWYFGYSQRAAMTGAKESQVDFQIHCGPALGAFNQWVKGTGLESWRARHVDDIGLRLMTATASHLLQHSPATGGFER